MDFQFFKHWRLIVSAIMVLVLLTGCVVVADPTTVPDTQLPGTSTTTVLTTAATTQPNTTARPTTLPATTALPTTVPVTTVPPTTVPETTVPETTVPETTVPETTVPPEPEVPFPTISGSNAFVYDTRSGQFLYLSCDKYTALYPASITKLFTTYVAMQYLSVDTRITVGSERDMVIWDASVAGLNIGDTLTAGDLAKCALLVSGCEASYTLAVAAGRAILGQQDVPEQIAIQTFMVQVNQSAAMLGMINTKFVTPDGNHANDHAVSMDAYVILAKCCLEDPLISSIMSTYTDRVTVTNKSGKTRTLTLRNTNENMNPQNTEAYRPETVGMKTGYTSKAGACLLGAYRVDGGYLIIGVFGCPTYASRYLDAIALLEYYL